MLDPKKLVITQAGDFAKAAKEPAKKEEPKTPAAEEVTEASGEPHEARR